MNLRQAPARAAGPMRSAALLAALALGTPAAHAQTLKDALSDAYRDNPTLQAAEAEVRRADEQVPQARAGWRPQAEVTAGGGAAESEGASQRSNLSARRGPVYAIDLRVRQPLYNFGTSASIAQAEEGVQAARARLTAVEQDVLAHAAAAYADLFRALGVVELNASHEQSTARDLESVRRRFAAGELTASAVAESEASLAEATAGRAQAEADFAAARGNYLRWIGTPPDHLAEPAVPLDLPATEDDVVEASAASPGVVAADHAAKEADQGVGVSRGQKLPQFFLQGDVGASSQSILAAMSVPLYNGTLDPQVRAAKQLVEQRRLETEAERRAARGSAVAAWQKLVASRAKIAAYDAKVAAAERASESVGREQALGLRTVESTLAAHDRLLDARVSLSGARREEFQASIEVLASIGRLTARDLGLDVPYYDPARHYDAVRGKWWGTAIEGQ